MDLFVLLMKLDERLYKLKMKRTKKSFLTIEEIQEKMRNHENIPTNIFNAEKNDYIVKARTIYEPKPKIKKLNKSLFK